MGIPLNIVASNGVGVVSDDQLDTYVQTDQTVSQLRTFQGVTGMAVMLQGLVAPGDGGGGLFFWSSGIFTDDGVNTIVPPGSSGAWIRSTTTVFAAPGVFTNTQFNLGWSFILGGLSPSFEWHQTHPGDNATQALVAGIAIPSTSTVTEADAGYFYTTNLASATIAVACGFSARALAANTFNFAQNWVLSDDGFPGCSMVGCEVDASITGVGSTFYAWSYIMQSTQVGATTVGMAFQATVQPWAAILQSFDGASGSNAIILGAKSGPGPNVDSQQINFNSYDNTGTARFCSIAAQGVTGSSNMVLTADGTGAVITSGELGVFGIGAFLATTQVTGVGGFFTTFYSGASIIGSITYSGTTTAYNTTSDARLKDLHGVADGSVLRQLKVHKVTFKNDPGQVVRSAFLAHEVQEVVPHAVTGVKDAVYAEDVRATRRKLVHAKGEPRTEAVTRQERVVDRVVHGIYETDIRDSYGHVVHRKGEGYQRTLWKTNTITVHAKGEPYEANEYVGENVVIHRKGDPIHQMMDHSLLVPDIVAHCLELEARLAALEAKER